MTFHGEHSHETQGETRPCKCGRGPCRLHQRNCIECHKEANQRYRARYRRPSKTMRAIKSLIGA